MDSAELRKRTKAFALRIVKLASSLPTNRLGDVLGRQVLKSDTSIGANYREALRASSRRQFITTLEIALREAGERVIQRLDADRREPAIFLGRRRRIRRVPLGHHPRVVDLEDEAGVDDHPVLGLHRVRDREEEVFLRLVVVVGALQLDRARRDGGNERFLEAVRAERRLAMLGADRGSGEV